VTYAIAIGERRIETSHPGCPFRFAVGRDQALKGLDESVATMKVGGQRTLIVPPSLGYGAEGTACVPPNATLLIEAELLEIQ
jgi:FKBP-type peptidyl-prolyl cis-trans isomerase